MNRYDLGGHSGCKIFLYDDDDGHVFVRKISKEIDYNSRLRIQCKKQENFISKIIKTPKILDKGYTEDELFYFDMEYIQGITLVEYVKSIEIGKVKGLVEALVNSFVPQIFSEMTQEEKNNINRIFENKLSDLRKNLSHIKYPKLYSALDLLESHDWSNLSPSNCHGDLTLENIIIQDGKLYLIDFLDSFYDSWFLDIGTLLQDIEVMWSFRYQTNIEMNTILRLIVFRDLLLDEVKKINSDYVIEIYYSLLLKLIRIYPYIKDDLTNRFLDEKICIVMDIIHKIESAEGKKE